MVGTCVVYGCTNRQEKGGNISFFHFPHKNPPVLKQWANAVNRLHWHTYFGTIKKTSHFKASLHFRHALYKTGIVLIVFVSLRAFI